MADLMFIPTRGSARQKQTAEENGFNSTTFEAYKAKGKKKSTGPCRDTSIDTRQELDMKRVRFDVFKFGISGFSGIKKEQCQISHAIELGAKPPKNKNQNYKELMLSRKKQKEEELAEKLLIAAGKVKGLSSDKGHKWLYSKKQKQKEKLKKSGILDPYGKVGDKQIKKRKTPKH